ncbi:hypothetical protein ACIQFU_09800 [Streptomyces sp. NPDC093065]|uniref:hypothetical protein n=1 Tax=Streptomyces sp. NPDC093065 TaxID=3366021 RepID=UPI0037F8C358
MTAPVRNDLPGGGLIRWEAHVAGERFGPHETVVGGIVIPRPPGIRRLREEYELLRGRVPERPGQRWGAS